jgi:hypothetical protein
MFDLDAGVAGMDTLYVADASSGSGGGIRKFKFNGTAWSEVLPQLSTTPVYGIIGVASGSVVTLLVTNASKVFRVIDDGSTPTVVTIATAATNTAYRGIALAPHN